MRCLENIEQNKDCGIKDYKFISRIRNDGLASIFLAKHRHDRNYVLAKKYNIDNLNPKELELIMFEVITNRKIKHQNVQSIIFSLTKYKNVYIFMPFMAYGSCKDLLNNCFNTGFPETFLAVIIRCILQGIVYLHRQGIIHRSICAAHILLNPSNAVLTGLRHCVCNISHGQYITKLHHLENIDNKYLNWLAPEVLEQNLFGYNELADIYSLGITCCELANGVEPFSDAQPTFMLTEKLRGNIPILLDRSTCPDHEIFINSKRISGLLTSKDKYSIRVFTDDFHQFTEICMKKRASDRWSALQLLSHSFFKQTRATSIAKEVQLYGLDITATTESKDVITEDEENENDHSDITWCL